MKMPSIRLTYFFGFLLTTTVIATTFYLQKYDGMMPCPLCVLQRIAFGLLGVLFFFGILTGENKIGRWLIGTLGALTAFGGIFLSGRQVWLQHLPPDKNADCGVSLEYLMHVLPYDQLLAKILQGTAECSVKSWELLGFSLAEWSFLFFILLFILCIAQMLRKS